MKETESTLRIGNRKCVSPNREWKAIACAVLGLWGIQFSAGAVTPENAMNFPERVEVFRVKTKSAQNKEVPFYVRVPKNYKAGRFYRLLFLCPHLNQDGLK